MEKLICKAILENHSSITSSLQLSVKRFSSITFFLSSLVKMALLVSGLCYSKERSRKSEC